MIDEPAKLREFEDNETAPDAADPKPERGSMEESISTIPVNGRSGYRPV